MNILFTNHGLKLRGGTELFTAEITRALAERGNQVAVYVSLPGPEGDRLKADGIEVLDHPAACPFKPDIIHAQHHLQAMTALCSWPDVPGVYMMHGIEPWEEHPPVHPRLLRYLAPSTHFGWWLEQECGLPREALVVIHTFFDPSRFVRVRPPNQRTGKALIYHNSISRQSPAWHAVHAACRAAGLSLDGIGRKFGQMVEKPEEILADYELVLASGRSAIEALASGCAVIPISAERITCRVHPELFDALLDLNFFPDPCHYLIRQELVEEEMALIRPEETAAVTERIRREANKESAVDRLLEVYQTTVDQYLSDPPANPRAEVQALAHLLQFEKLEPHK